MNTPTASLRGCQLLGSLQRPRAEQLLQAGERQLHLRFNPADAPGTAGGPPDRRGRSGKESTAALVISQRTAEGHVERILTKLGFTSRAQVAASQPDGEGAQLLPASRRQSSRQYLGNR